MSFDRYEELSDDQLETIDSICAKFEAALNSGDDVSIDVLVNSTPTDLRPHLFSELLATEAEFRLAENSQVDWENLLARFPEFVQQINEFKSKAPPTQTERVDSSSRNPTGDTAILGDTPAVADLDRTHLITDDDTDIANPGRREQSTAQHSDEEFPNSSPSAPSRSAADLADEDANIGDMQRDFGRYRIKKLLGKGGMGSVYLAQDKHLDRLVAIKVPDFAESADDAEARFLREARAMATVEHPNLCPIHDVGEIDGQTFLSMAYIKGKPLSRFSPRGQSINGPEAIELVRKLALAIQEAHEAGIVHRDLKPANVMINERGEPIVMDFGLAQRNIEGEATLTHQGAIVGSPAYMSPEQVEAKHDQVGPRTDIYSLGVILYELLTGRRPFEGSTMSVLGQIAAGIEPSAPSSTSIVAPEFESVCLKAMAHRQADRYQTAQEFADALGAALVAVRDDSAADTRIYNPSELGLKTAGKQPSKKSKLTIGLVAGAALAAVVSFVIATPHGEVVVSAPDDADIELRLKQNGEVVEIISAEDGWKISIDEGAYQISLHPKGSQAKKDLQFAVRGTDTLVVSRDKKSEITIVRRNADQLASKPETKNAPRKSGYPADLTPKLLPRRPHASQQSTAHFVKADQELGTADYRTRWISTGDLDNDGHIDAVITQITGTGNPLAEPNQVWLNEGDGTFKPAQALPGEFCNQTELGDIDGDGDLDLLVPRATDKEESLIFFNDGKGNFAESDMHFPRERMLRIVLGDLDADGDLDAVSCQKTGIRVWKNDGDGAFQDSDQRPLSDVTCSQVVFAHVDRDDDLDAVILAQQSAIHVCLNDGNGTLQPTTQLGNDKVSRLGIALFDYNQDGLLDVYTTGVQTTTAHSLHQLWLNNGDGEFTFVRLDAVERLTQPSVFPATLASADMNGDGRDDLVFATSASTKVGPFATQVSLNHEDRFEDRWVGFSENSFVALADFDNDGAVDVLQGNVHAPDQVWLNKPKPPTKKGTILLSQTTNQLGRGTTYDIALGDLDKDGDVDAVTAEIGDHLSRVWLNEGNGQFIEHAPIDVLAPAVELADIDNDGDLDAVFSAGQKTIWLNDGKGNFTDSGWDFQIEAGRDVATADFDKDGRQDIIIVRSGQNTILYNNGAGRFDKRVSPSAATYGIAVGDLSGDGFPDVIVCNSDVSRIWINRTNRTFGTFRQALVPASHAAIGDFNQDGHNDFATVSIKGIQVWESKGGAEFADPINLTGYGLSTQRTRFADLNGDGFPELIVVCSKRQPNLLWQNNRGQFADPTRIFGASSSLGFDVADVDNDGSLDLAIANISERPGTVWLTKILRNDGKRTRN